MPGPCGRADGALAVFQTKYTLIDEQDIPLVESYSFEVRPPPLPARPSAVFPGSVVPLPARAAPGPAGLGSRRSCGSVLPPCPAPAQQLRERCACSSPDWRKKNQF